MIIAEVNSFVDLVLKLTSFADRLQDGWYKGSAEVDSFRDQVLMLTQKHCQWSAQLRRHGLSEDERLLKAIQAAVQVLETQEKYVRRLEKSLFSRLTRKAFPGQVSYSLNKILAIVDAGPQLLAGRVTTYDLMERSRAQTPTPLPFITDRNYVPILGSILEIRKALEDEEGSRVVTVFGGPGMGKSSVVKYLALHYHEEKIQSLRGTQPETVNFPDGVFYLFCGKGAQDRVQQLQLELLDCLGFGTSSVTPSNDLAATEVQERGYLQIPSHQMKLRSHLTEQKLLIVLDDLWESEVLQQLLVPAKEVKYLITSQMREIWGPASRIQMRNPTMDEARKIMSNYTKGLPTKGKFPENIEIVTDAIISRLGYHPLSLADIGNSINSSRATDSSHWEVIRDNIQAILDDNDKVQGSPVVYDQPYNLSVKASMMLMVEALHPEAQRLLFLIALLGGQRLPETVVTYFYKLVQGHQNSSFFWKYNNQEKYLEERSLVDLHLKPGGDSTLAAHGLRMHYIREHRAPDVLSIASQILGSSDPVGAEVIQMGDAESTLVMVLSAMYFTTPFKDVVVSTLENHLRILNGGVISQNINSSMDALDLVKRTVEIKALVPLLNLASGDRGWKQQAHEYAKKIIIKLACQGRLDDYSMARLLQLPQTTSAACNTIWQICLTSDYDENGPTFSSTNCETMSTLLTLWQDDATSTKSRIAVSRALMWVLTFERKDTIINLASKFMELLVMESNPSLQSGLVGTLTSIHVATRGVIMTGEFTTILEVLMGLLVFSKDCHVRVSAGDALSWFARWKCTALKMAAIPNALEKLFDLFLSKESLRITPITRQLGLDVRFHSPSFFAGYILGALSCEEENRMRFHPLKSGLDGLGDVLARMEGTWRSIPEKNGQKELEERASIAAGILGELALGKELRDYISSLPAVEGGLLFLQKVEMARWLTGQERDAPYYPRNSARAIAIIYSNCSNPRSRDVPSVEQLQDMFSCDKSPTAERSIVTDLHCIVEWTRALAHLEMGAYKSALENLEAAQDYLDQILALDDWDRRVIVPTANPWSYSGYYSTRAKELLTYKDFLLSSTRIFLQAMLEDHAGALLGANKRVEEAKGFPYGYIRELTNRGIVKRLARDLQGALDDLNAAYETHALYWWAEQKYEILKHRGYVKHLLEDDVGAKVDAEAAQKLKLDRTEVEETTDRRRFWDFRKLPANYLGYLL